MSAARHALTVRDVVVPGIGPRGCGPARATTVRCERHLTPAERWLLEYEANQAEAAGEIIWDWEPTDEPCAACEGRA